MTIKDTRLAVAVLCGFAAGCGETEPEAQEVQTQAQEEELFQGEILHLNSTGAGFTVTTLTNHLSELVRNDNPYFEDLGTNGRRCVTCHRPAEGFSIRPDLTKLRFALTGGTDPLFRTNDGTNTPLADVSSVSKRLSASSMLLERGVIRVGIGVPTNAEFRLIAVDDPYHYATEAELSLFRRPLTASNLKFNSSLMWDGRETAATLALGLTSQAAGATRGHAAQPEPLAATTLDRIVNFESDLYQAQVLDKEAGRLTSEGGRGGPTALTTQEFVRGNFNIYDAWATLPNENGVNKVRASIARGQALFNLNRGGASCALFCHNAQNVGTNTRNAFFNIGVSKPELRKPEVPLYTFERINADPNAPREIRQTTDPGRALITGRWRDMDAFKVPNLRGLASRAPYFHDGSAKTLDEVVDHYEQQFNFVLTAQEQADLVAFLRSL